MPPKFGPDHGADPELRHPPHGVLAARKPIRVLVGFSPGGSTDVLGQLIAQKLQERLGQPVIIENKACADAANGTDIDRQTMQAANNSKLRHESSTADRAGWDGTAAAWLAAKQACPSFPCRGLVPGSRRRDVE